MEVLGSTLVCCTAIPGRTLDNTHVYLFLRQQTSGRHDEVFQVRRRQEIPPFGGYAIIQRAVFVGTPISTTRSAAGAISRPEASAQQRRRRVGALHRGGGGKGLLLKVKGN